jgi:small subunit ribosomal protein S20
MLTIGQEVKDLPNIKSSIKRVKITNAKTLRNTKIKSSLKTSIKKCKEAIANNDDSAAEIMKQTIKDIDVAVSKNVLHKNNAARKKSKLTKAMSAALEANK